MEIQAKMDIGSHAKNCCFAKISSGSVWYPDLRLLLDLDATKMSMFSNPVRTIDGALEAT